MGSASAASHPPQSQVRPGLRCPEVCPSQVHRRLQGTPVTQGGSGVLLALEARELGHLLGRELKVEELHVLLYAVPPDALRDDLEAHLHRPPQQNLRRRLPRVGSHNLGHGPVIELVLLAPEDGAVSLHQDVMLLAVLEQRSAGLVHQGVHFNLVHRRHWPAVVVQGLYVRNVEVGNANRHREPVMLKLKQRVPSLDELPGVRRVH
mmetsp:Transcript_38479/g.107222  ORF Transcript_38479/g.107222 Transcript_38479/m.107222 type:complete len:206 (-) Transcript_38479:303-920(-)